MNTAVLVGGFALFIGFALWSHRQGKKSAQRDYMEDVLDDLDKAQEIERDVDRMSDADVDEQLRDWKR